MNRVQLVLFGSIGLIVLLAILTITGVLPGIQPRPVPPFTLEAWGPEDPADIWQDLASDYREVLETATITYIKKDKKTYERELVNALASGSGPDIFFLYDSWLERHMNKVKPLADESLGYRKKNVKSIFTDGIAQAIVSDQGELLGVPLALDTLALFFNRDYFNAANIPHPPETWTELAEDAEKLTKRSDIGSIQRAGVALGTAANVNHAADIFSLLVYQNGGEILDPRTGESKLQNPAARSALVFYTSLADSRKKTYSWNAFFDTSLNAFARGDAAMALGYARDALKIVAENPQLNFDVAPLPQLTAQRTAINYGRFGLWAVSRNAGQSELAWNFLLWLQSKVPQKKYIDALGLPPARRDLVAAKPPRDYLIPFYDQALSARTQPLVGGETLAAILAGMIDAVVNRQLTVDQALSRAHTEINSQIRIRPQ